jgi:hypothetical protein
MRIGKYQLRLPFVEMVEITLEEEIAGAMRRLIGEEIAEKIMEAHHRFNCPMVALPVCSCEKAANIARGN